MPENSFKFRNIWKPLLIATTLAFVYATVLVKLGRDWWTDENYSHGLLVPFVIGFIVWLEYDRLKKLEKNPSGLIGAGLIAAALLLLLAGTLGAELFTQRGSFVLMIAGIVVYFFGTRILNSFVVPFVLLLLAIPIPQIIFNKIAMPLQMWASQAAIWGIRLFEIPSVRKGNVIEILPVGATQIVALEVVEACSGIRSLMTLVTLALVLAYFTREPEENIDGGQFGFFKSFDFWRTIILMLAAIPIAVLTNAARVTLTGILTYYYGKQAAGGWWHELSGWLVYLIALILLIGVNFVLKKFKVGSSKFKAESDLPITNHQSPNTNYQTFSLIIVLLCGGIFINWFQQRGEAQVERQLLQQFPAQIGDWRQQGSDGRFSEQTESVLRASDYVTRDYTSSGNRTANVYIGYYASQRTGATYHSPQNCLPGAGWEMKQPEFVEIKTPAGKTFTANRYLLKNGDYHYVMIYWYQGRGRANADEYTDKIYTILDSFTKRRSDGAMVRVMTPVSGDDQQAALNAVIDLSAQIEDNLARFVPE